MWNNTQYASNTPLLQGLSRSVVLLVFNKQPFTEDTPQAQGISVPRFREMY